MCAFCKILFGVSQSQLIKPLLIRFTEIARHFFNRCRNQEQISFDFTGEQAACKILIDNCRRTAIFATANINDGNTAAANRYSDYALVQYRLNGVQLHNLIGEW